MPKTPGLTYTLSAPERRALRDVAAALPPIAPDHPLPTRGAGAGVTCQHPAPDQTAYGLRHLPPELGPLRHHLRGLPRAEVAITVLTGLPPVEAPAALLLVIGALIGDLREYSGHGAPVIEVSDKAAAPTRRPSSDNSLFFDLHTDMSFYDTPPDLVGFLMLRQSPEGGETLFCDGQALAAALSARCKAALKRPFRFPAPPHLPNAPDQLFPILTTGAGDAPWFRYRRDGLRPCDAEQAEALAAFEAALAAHQFHLKLHPGEAVVYSNRTILHGRAAYRDAPDGPGRAALRAYFAQQDRAAPTDAP